LDENSNWDDVLTHMRGDTLTAPFLAIGRDVLYWTALSELPGKFCVPGVGMIF
jgi:hypothetical protein